VRKGGTWLKTTLVQCAWAAVKKKDSYLQAQFYRIKARSSEPRSLNAGGIPHPHSRKYEVESAYRARRLSNHLHLGMPAADRQRKSWIDFTANKLAWGFVHERSDKLEQRLLLRPASTRQEVRQFNAGDLSA
jgi:hypothetical protein